MNALGARPQISKGIILNAHNGEIYVTIVAN